MLDLTKTYKTRDGREVTGLKLREDGLDMFGYPIEGLLSGEREIWTAEGWEFSSGGDDDLDLILVPEAEAPAIDWTKPIEFFDGSPAKFYGYTGEALARVSVKGTPDFDSCNHYKSDGTHYAGFAQPVRNVPEQAPKVPERYNVVRVMSTMAESLEEALALAKSHVGAGETLGVFKLVATVEQPDLPPHIVTIAD